jgi:hypothetical protein
MSLFVNEEERGSNQLPRYGNGTACRLLVPSIKAAAVVCPRGMAELQYEVSGAD